MSPLIDRLLANDLADLEGLEVKVTIPVSEALANDLITPLLDEYFDSAAPVKKSADVEYIQLLKKLRPNVFKISFEDGKAVINVELKR